MDSPVLISQSSLSFLSSLWISARKTCKHLIFSSSISFRFTSFNLVSFADMLRRERRQDVSFHTTVLEFRTWNIANYYSFLTSIIFHFLFFLLVILLVVFHVIVFEFEVVAINEYLKKIIHWTFLFYKASSIGYNNLWIT